jgi:predicted ATP-binding protein involved in virulence
MSINKQAGFVFQTSTNEPLSPASLSTGEQHEVVLLYELLFRVQRNSLILVDEPEISLHIAWQEQFLRDLRDITQLSDFDVLIATHSPQIISDRWDLAVELKAPALKHER